MMWRYNMFSQNLLLCYDRFFQLNYVKFYLNNHQHIIFSHYARRFAYIIQLLKIIQSFSHFQHFFINTQFLTTICKSSSISDNEFNEFNTNLHFCRSVLFHKINFVIKIKNTPHLIISNSIQVWALIMGLRFVILLVCMFKL